MNNFFKKHDFKTFELKDIDQLEEKQAIAKKVSLIAKNGDCIGVGSGTTSYLVLLAIDQLIKEGKLKNISFIPSSLEMELTLARLDLETTSLLNKNPNWLFDGADYVLNKDLFIKGRGGALFREKLLFKVTQKKLLCIDKTKLVSKLNQTMPVPIEIEVSSLNHVLAQLDLIGANDVVIRKGSGKDGPVITENGNLLLDTYFKNIDSNLEKEIKEITGVIESGLFTNFDVELIHY